MISCAGEGYCHKKLPGVYLLCIHMKIQRQAECLLDCHQEVGKVKQHLTILRKDERMKIDHDRLENFLLRKKVNEKARLYREWGDL